LSGNTPQSSTVSDCSSPSQTAESWRLQVGTDDPLLAMSVKSDALRDVFVATATGGVRKLDETGTTVWVRPFGSLVDVDSEGSSFVAGSFSNALTLDAKTTLVAAGGSDAYVAKLDSNGAVVFAVALGGSADEEAKSIAIAPDGGVVVSGDGLGVVKLDATGKTSWTRPIDGAVAVDSVGDVVVTGALVGSATFGSDTLVSAGGQDVLVVKLSPEGDYLWSRRFGDTSGAQRGQAITVDATDDVIVGGVVDGAVDFGGGSVTVPPGTCPSEVSCTQAGFVLKLDASGGFLWSQAEAPAKAISGVAVDSAGNVYATGSYPGDVPPYRTTLLVGFDSGGSKRTLPAYSDVAGLGHAIATDSCGDVVFTFATPGASTDELGRAYVAKLFVAG
jgi:hypothetical protein